MMGMDKAIEDLSRLEHEQWRQWASSIMKTEKISQGRKDRWETLFVDYDELSDEMKEHDRQWARRSIELLTKKHGFYMDDK